MIALLLGSAIARLDMLDHAMDKVRSTPAGAVPPAITPELESPGECVYPDKLDPALLRIAAVCVLASIMSILDATVVSVAQRTFIAEFGSTQAVVAWTMTGYTLALAAAIPLTGWAADRFGTKRLWMGSVLAFTLGSLLCAMAPNIVLLIIFRVAQGLGGGMLMPLGFMILTRIAGPARLGRMMAVLGVPMLLAPIGGPILGGWLIGEFSWPWIFLINLPIGLAALILASFVFPRDQPEPSETFDRIGALLLVPGLAVFLFGVSSVPERGTVTDRHVLMPAIIGLALIVAFILHARRRTNHPLIDLRLFQHRVFTMANMTLLLFAIAFFGSILLLPGYFQQVMHQTPMQSGMMLAPQGIGAMLTLPFAGMFMDRRGPGKAVLLGVTLITVGLGTIAVGIATRAPYAPTLLAGLAIMGMGMGCTTMPLSAAAMQTLKPPEIARGSTLVSVNQQISCSIGTALMAVILTSQANDSENITAANKLVALQQESAARGVPIDPSAIPRQTLAADFSSKVLDDLSQANALVFALGAALMVVALIPAAFLPRKPATPQTASSLSA